MLRKPSLVHSKMLNICFQLFSVRWIQFVSFFLKTCTTFCCLYIDLQNMLPNFLLTFHFQNDILIQLFTSVALYVALYIRTKYCSNKAISNIFFVYFTFLLYRCKFDKHFCNFWKKFRCQNYLKQDKREEWLLTLLQGVMLFCEPKYILNLSPSQTPPIILGSQVYDVILIPQQ